MSTSSSGILEDLRIGVRLKISALWIAMLLLFASAFLAIGLFASSLSDNQMIAAVVAFILLLILWMIGQVGSGLSLGGDVSSWFTALSVTDHFNNSFPRGVIDLTDVLFYLLLTGVMLWTTVQVVEARRWRA